MMRLLLMLPDDAQRQMCTEYFTLRGCDVDLAADTALAQSLVRFCVYDAIVTDCDGDETNRLMSLARRRNAAVLPVALTTGEDVHLDPSVITLTKPFALGMVLELAQDRVCEHMS